MAEVQEVLLNAPSCQVDARHSEDEQRYVALRVTNEGDNSSSAFTVRRNRVRVISARPMSRKERAIHERSER